MLVGVFDDALAQQNPAVTRAYADISRDAGFNAVMVSATWTRGRRGPRRTSSECCATSRPPRAVRT